MSHHALRAASSYRQVGVQSGTPLELVVMLYDGALRFVAAAQAALERRDIAARAAAVSRALAILSELQSTLDLERGGELAERLDQLYTYLTGRLVDASFHQDANALEEVARLLRPLRDAWQTIAREGTGAR